MKKSYIIVIILFLVISAGILFTISDEEKPVNDIGREEDSLTTENLFDKENETDLNTLYNRTPTREEISSSEVVAFSYCGNTYYYRPSDEPDNHTGAIPKIASVLDANQDKHFINCDHIARNETLPETIIDTSSGLEFPYENDDGIVTTTLMVYIEPFLQALEINDNGDVSFFSFHGTTYIGTYSN